MAKGLKVCVSEVCDELEIHESDFIRCAFGDAVRIYRDPEIPNENFRYI